MNDGIVLLAKQPNQTSFYSLNSVKKALGTSKVGHTGTLDSFAQGLLVVCVGKMTKLAGNITEFDKSYETVIQFGEETDTLEYTGNVIKKTPLPKLEKLETVVKSHIGLQMQTPPDFSAIHINGKRASDLAREGKQAEIPQRQINVFDAKITETLVDDDGNVTACKIFFSVSKGTYIRSLARDIAAECESSGHLIGLYRTKVGNFKIEDAAGYGLLEDFTIESCVKRVREYRRMLLEETQAEVEAAAAKSTDKTEYATSDKSESNKKTPDKKSKVLNNLDVQKDEIVKKEISERIRAFDKECAAQCGFYTIDLKNAEIEKEIENGKNIRTSWFTENTDSIPENKDIAVFSNERFCALIYKANNSEKKNFFYKFVIK